MKKITFLMLHLNYGGIEKQVTTLANNLVSDYEVEIISLYDIVESKSFYKLDDRIKVKFIFPYGPNREELKNNLSKFNIKGLFREIKKGIKMIYMKYFGLKKVIQNINTDILISSRIEFSKQITRDDIITISQEHSYINDPKYLKKCKKAFKNIDYLVVMTKQAKELYIKWLEKYDLNTKVVVIPNMIDKNTTGEISSLDNGQMISIGRLEEVKDFKTLIIMFSAIIKYHGMTLKIIGEGSQRQELEELIKKYELEKSVILTGRLDSDKIKEELLKSDIFVLTSKSESFSLALCEAMNYGVPCVAFDVDVGPREIIDNEKTGFIVPDRNISAMSKRIDELLNSKELRVKIGKEAHEKVARYYPENVVKMWYEIFKNK